MLRRLSCPVYYSKFIYCAIPNILKNEKSILVSLKAAHKGNFAGMGKHYTETNLLVIIFTVIVVEVEWHVLDLVAVGNL
jgi:hypothetical protein